MRPLPSQKTPSVSFADSSLKEGAKGDSSLKEGAKGGGGGMCDGCGFLEIERPVNRYDVWRACCCDPDKPLPGARRVVGVAPGGSRTGPVGVRRPRWCGRKEVKT